MSRSSLWLVAHPRARAALHFLLSLGVGVAVAACLAASSGCTSAARQRTVTAVAVAAVAADHALADSYAAHARDALDAAVADGDTFAEWCATVTPAWHLSARIGCGIVALADLALAGQRLIDAEASDAGWLQWVAATAPVVSAVLAAWSAAEDPPQELRQAAALLSVVAGPGAALPPSCAIVGPPPGCPAVEVQP